MKPNREWWEPRDDDEEEREERGGQGLHKLPAGVYTDYNSPTGKVRVDSDGIMTVADATEAVTILGDVNPCGTQQSGQARLAADAQTANAQANASLMAQIEAQAREPKRQLFDQVRACLSPDEARAVMAYEAEIAKVQTEIADAVSKLGAQIDNAVANPDPSRVPYSGIAAWVPQGPAAPSLSAAPRCCACDGHIAQDMVTGVISCGSCGLEHRVVRETDHLRLVAAAEASARANLLADECGVLRDQNKELLAENARLRRGKR